MKSIRVKAAAVASALALFGLVGCDQDNEAMIKNKGTSVSKAAPGASNSSEGAAKAAAANSPMNSDPGYLKK